MRATLGAVCTASFRSVLLHSGQLRSRIVWSYLTTIPFIIVSVVCIAFRPICSYFSGPDANNQYMYYFQMTSGSLPNAAGAMKYCTFADGQDSGNSMGQGEISGDTCFPIGLVAQQSWVIDTSQNPQVITITFSGGQEGRQSVVTVTCDPSADDPAFVVKGETRTMVYQVDMTSKYACGGPAPPPETSTTTVSSTTTASPTSVTTTSTTTASSTTTISTTYTATTTQISTIIAIGGGKGDSGSKRVTTVLAVLLAAVTFIFAVALLVLVTRIRKLATQNVHLQKEARGNRGESVETTSNPLHQGGHNTYEEPLFGQEAIYTEA
jgi:hypothetical protein